MGLFSCIRAPSSPVGPIDHAWDGSVPLTSEPNMFQGKTAAVLRRKTDTTLEKEDPAEAEKELDRKRLREIMIFTGNYSPFGDEEEGDSV